MTTVARTFRSVPFRSAMDTWTQIVELLTKGANASARTELLAAAGVASSVIADQYVRDEPIIVTCDGPRTRIYCTYDDKALDGTDASESTLGFDPLASTWQVSLPCGNDDLGWVQSALKGCAHVCARALGEGVAKQDAAASANDDLVIDEKRFLGR